MHAELPCGVDQAIIGLMDPAHGPFVHQAWWWRSRHSIREKEKRFEPIPNGFRMSPHAPSANSAPYKILKLLTGEPASTTIDFVLPNQRFEQIRAGNYWLSSRTTVTPIRPDDVKRDLRKPGGNRTNCSRIKEHGADRNRMLSGRVRRGGRPKKSVAIDAMGNQSELVFMFAKCLRRPSRFSDRAARRAGWPRLRRTPQASHRRVWCIVMCAK